jgi:LuxR family transcriptional regulator, maltose regulon positive regulatory protein
MKTPFHAKVASPRLRRVIPRERLFRRLDSLADYPITWISSPAGSGKTTLIASYIQARNIPALWYRVDDGDSDVGTFFYYMAEAAKALKRKKQPLPLFAPDFRAGIDAFTRHYFTALIAKMPIPGMLVFDNYQDAPEECEFHEVITKGLKLVPEGLRAIIVSRREAPSAFVSLQVDRCLSSLGWNDLRFTVDEVREIIESREKGPVAEDVLQRIHENTQGWAAALILMMDEDGTRPPAAVSVGSSAVFDYLAVEVFRKLDDRTKEFLCATALLPSVSPEVASQLTGVEEAGALLSYLSRNHYFTEWHGADYTYHPLFREFLINQARKTYDAETLRSLHVKAAQTLTASGKTEEAVRLLLDVNEYAQALPAIVGHAPQLLSQGRTNTLEEWAERLPEEMRDNTPWLMYWRAMGRLVTDPHESKRFLEKAFALFAVQEDRIGLLLSAAGIINAIFFTWDDCHPFDEWIAWVDRNVDIDTALMAVDVEAQVASAMVCALTWRQPGHTHASAWAERAARAIPVVQDPFVKAAASVHLTNYYGSMVNLKSMNRFGEEIRSSVVVSGASPLVNLTFTTSVAYVYQGQGLFEKSLAVTLQAIALAEQMGAYYHLGMACFPAAVVAFELRDERLIAELLERMEHFVAPRRRGFLARFFWLRASARLSAGRIEEALHDAEDATRIANEIGLCYGEVLGNLAWAYVLRRMGRYADAHERLAKVAGMIAPLGMTHHHYLLSLALASLFLDEGEQEESRGAVAEAFRVGRVKGCAYSLYGYWQPDEMARLCWEAVSAGIEVEYARELIRRHHLVPPDSRPESLADWPWPVSIRTFGGFELSIDGLVPSNTRRKPLDLLKALVSLGGEEVREETIEDALWPEAEGDVAHISFKTTLSRLRKIVGEKAIEVKEGRVTINRKMVWLDLWALESLAERVFELGRHRDSVTVPELERLAGLALDIYRGDFLYAEEAPWFERTRERLRARFAKTIERLGRMLANAGEYDKTNQLYEQAIDRGISVASPESRGRQT